jgi:hypothetical protein
MKVLQSRNIPTYWSFRHALPFEGKRSAFPPLGLLTVSASCCRASWERRLVDLNVQIAQVFGIEWADMVFVTAMLVQKDHSESRRGWNASAWQTSSSVVLT